jgi:hypothetical protein
MDIFENVLGGNPTFEGSMTNAQDQRIADINQAIALGRDLNV